MRALHFYCNHLAAPGEDTLVYLAQGCRSGRVRLQRAEYLGEWHAELGLDHRRDMREGFWRHLILEGNEDGECTFRQEVCPRTEELSEFDHQDTELQRGGAKLRQHADQHVDIGANIALA